jgi:hypothetical protein
MSIPGNRNNFVTTAFPCYEREKSNTDAQAATFSVAFTDALE